MPRLRRSDCAAPGISRRRRGRGFEYRDPDGARIEDPEVIAADRRAGDPAGMGGGVDLPGSARAPAGDRARRGRAQAVPLPRALARPPRPPTSSIRWSPSAPACRVCAAASRASCARRRGADACRRVALERELVLACAVRLLDLGFFRIGSEDYAERNESYGLTTMLREHVTIEGGELIFDFPAKSGQRRVQAVADNESLAVIATLKRRRGRGAAARLPRGQPLARAERRGGQRIHQGRHGGRLQRQGLPHVERDGAGRRRRSRPADRVGRRRATRSKPPSRPSPPTSATRPPLRAPPTSTRA